MIRMSKEEIKKRYGLREGNQAKDVKNALHDKSFRLGIPNV